jgi:hypothetical protein
VANSWLKYSSAVVGRLRGVAEGGEDGGLHEVPILAARAGGVTDHVGAVGLQDGGRIDLAFAAGDHQVLDERTRRACLAEGAVVARDFAQRGAEGQHGGSVLRRGQGHGGQHGGGRPHLDGRIEGGQVAAEKLHGLLVADLLRREGLAHHAAQKLEVGIDVVGEGVVAAYPRDLGRDDLLEQGAGFGFVEIEQGVQGAHLEREGVHLLREGAVEVLGGVARRPHCAAAERLLRALGEEARRMRASAANSGAAPRAMPANASNSAGRPGVSSAARGRASTHVT